MYLEDHSKNAGVTVDPFSLDALIAWLEKQPADGTYIYADWEVCLLGQYTLGCGGFFNRDKNYQIGEHVLKACGSDLAYDVARPNPKTFGGALARAIVIKECGK
jgi:hypothetical protein